MADLYGRKSAAYTEREIFPYVTEKELRLDLVQRAQKMALTENWNRSSRHGRLDPKTFTPDPKNPILARFFRNIGRADKLGSGVRNLYKYTKIYSGGEPELIEGDVFKTIIPLIGIGAVGSTGAIYCCRNCQEIAE